MAKGVPVNSRSQMDACFNKTSHLELAKSLEKRLTHSPACAFSLSCTPHTAPCAHSPSTAGEDQGQ